MPYRAGIRTGDAGGEPPLDLTGVLRDNQFAMMDMARQAQAQALAAFGFGPNECTHRRLAAGPCWRLRDYTGSEGGPAVLIVAAPIKRPYIWDLGPAASAIRYCLNRDLRVYLLEWVPPSPGQDNAGQGDAGLDEYAGQAIAECVAIVAGRTGGRPPFLIGHSLGGTLAAVAGALAPRAIQGLVLLGAPLCFGPGTSRFRDRLVAIVPPLLHGIDIVPGSLLSQVSALAAPETFIWSRLADAALSVADPRAMAIHARVEHWSLDEVALPGRLVQQIVDWLYREDRFCRGALQVGGTSIGPSSLRVPWLAVVNTADEVAPLASITPFVEAAAGSDARVIEYPGEAGIGLQHVAVLVGPRARLVVWPQIVAWLGAQC